MALEGSIAYKLGMKFGEKVQILMHQSGHTQKALAFLIGTQQSSISNVLAGKQCLRPASLLALSKLYGVSIDSLIDDSRPIERVTDAERLVFETVRKIGADEALDRLWLAKIKVGSIADRGEGTKEMDGNTRNAWGQTGRKDEIGGKSGEPKPRRNPGV